MHEIVHWWKLSKISFTAIPQEKLCGELTVTFENCVASWLLKFYTCWRINDPSKSSLSPLPRILAWPSVEVDRRCLSNSAGETWLASLPCRAASQKYLQIDARTKAAFCQWASRTDCQMSQCAFSSLGGSAHTHTHTHTHTHAHTHTHFVSALRLWVSWYMCACENAYRYTYRCTCTHKYLYHTHINKYQYKHEHHVCIHNASWGHIESAMGHHAYTSTLLRYYCTRMYVQTCIHTHTNTRAYRRSGLVLISKVSNTCFDHPQSLWHVIGRKVMVLVAHKLEPTILEPLPEMLGCSTHEMD